MTPSLRITVAALLLSLTAGCGSVLRSDAPLEQIYVLRPGPAAEAGAVVPGMIAVARPQVQPGLVTPRIALTRPGNRLDYYAASRWGAPLPQVVSAFAAEALAGSRRFEQVVEGTRGGAQFELQLTVRHFEAEYADAGAPQARVALECLLTAGTPRRLLGACDGAATVAATADRMGAIVMAMEAAAQQAMDQVVTKAAQLATTAP